MKILHLSNNPLSNAPANLAQCQNDYGHQATLYLNRKAGLNKIHVGGLLWHETPMEVLTQSFKEADVIHYHNFCWDLEVFKTHPFLLALAHEKPGLIQYHSPRHSIQDFEPSIADKSIKHAVIAQYHVREYPECEFMVPNVVPIYDAKYQGVAEKWNDAMPTISYAPSNINLTGWDNKGYSIVDPILRKLEREGLIARDVIINVPYEECMLRKRWAHIGIDEVSTGSYHLSSLEYLSMGIATFAHIDAQTFEALRTITNDIGDWDEGVYNLPWLNVKKNNLEESLRYWSTARDELRARGAASRAWMEKFWNPKDHVKRFEKIYRSL